MAKSHPCPKCGRKLTASGTVQVDDGRPLPVFQCDECIDEWEVEGEIFPCSLTFVLDAKGRLLDSESLEPIDPARYKSK